MLNKTRIVFVLFVVLVSGTLYYLFRPDPYSNASTNFSSNLASDVTSGQESFKPEVIEWKEYVSKKPPFHVLLPTIPQHAEESVTLQSGQGNITYNLYLSQAKSGTTFMVSVIEYPKEYTMSDPESILDGVLKEMLMGNNKNKLLHSAKGVFKTFPSIDFSLESPEIATKSRAFINGQTLYVLTVVDKVPADIEGHFKEFADSFQSDT